jgi:peptidoglycan/LPS O-acetylase OafA/YrhL
LRRFGTNKRNIPTLDGWRAIAILLVLWAHQGNVFYPTSDAYLRGGLFYFGTWGVPIFFGLSGLLITKLLLEEESGTGRIDLKAFYLRRCFRILPPLLVFLAVVAVAGLWESKTELVSSVFFFRNYLPWRLGGWYTGHLWSLSVEEHFYFLWPGLLVWVGVRRGWVPAVALSVMCGLWRWWRGAPVTDPRTDLRLDSLLLGAALAFALHSPQGRELLRRFLTAPVWILAGGLLFVAIRLELGFAAALLIPLLITGTVTHPAWAFSKTLDLRPIRWLGRISYSLYLWQQIFLYPGWQPHPIGAGVQKFPLSIALAFACAIASYYLVEKPTISLGRALASRGGPAFPR